LKEVVYDFEEFKAKVDSTKPIHHEGFRKPLDKHGILHEVLFRMYGVSEDLGCLLIFEHKEIIDCMHIPKEFQKSHNAYEDLRIYAKHVMISLLRSLRNLWVLLKGDGNHEC